MLCFRVELREPAHLLSDRQRLLILVCHRVSAGESLEHALCQVKHYKACSVYKQFHLNVCGFVHFQNYAESLCRSFCDLLKDITNEGQVQVLKVRTHTHSIKCCINTQTHKHTQTDQC